jgi:GGDEF domain-containing protein/ABC-type sugar transport system substrate-binding protein
MAAPPTFALLLTRLDGWYQSQVWEGANAAAKLSGIRLVGMVGSALGDFHGDGGSSEIYSMAASGCIDGYLPLVGSLANANGIGAVERLFQKLPPRPTVCIGVKLNGFPVVAPGEGGIDEIVRHLVVHHGLRRIAYLSGPLVNPDAQRRLDDFRRTMAACGLDFSLDWMDQGGFTKENGEVAVERLLHRVGIPQAIVCANDAMAFGAQRILTLRGLRVPQNVVLTGYDDIEESRVQSPPLTTVSAHPFEVAFRAVEKLTELLRQGSTPLHEIIPTRMVLRPSCGCNSATHVRELPKSLMENAHIPSVDDLREQLAEGGLDKIWQSLQEASFEQLDIWERVLQEASEAPTNAPEAESIGLFRNFLAAGRLAARARETLSTRHQLELHQVMREQYGITQTLMSNLDPNGFADRFLEAIEPWQSHRMRILLFNQDLAPLAMPEFTEGSFRMRIDSCSGIDTLNAPEPFLPPDDTSQEIWTILSLSMRQEHYGLLQLRGWATNQLFLESLRLMLVTILASAYRFRLERGMHEELRKLSQRDELTGLLNRRGFLDHGRILVHKALRDHQKIGVVLCDLDGLKQINDFHGHFDGDLAIRALGMALEDTFRPTDVLARLGGDEFAVLAAMPAGGGSGARDGSSGAGAGAPIDAAPTALAGQDQRRLDALESRRRVESGRRDRACRRPALPRQALSQGIGAIRLRRDLIGNIRFRIFSGLSTTPSCLDFLRPVSKAPTMQKLSPLVLAMGAISFAAVPVQFTAGASAKADEVNKNFNYLDSAKATKSSVDLLTSAMVAKIDASEANSKLGAKVDTGTYGKFAREQMSKSVVDTSAKRRIDSLAVATKTADTTLARRVSSVEGKVAAPTSVDWSNVKGTPSLWSWSPSNMVASWINSLPGKMENNVMGFEAGMGTDSGAIAFQKRAVSGTSATVLDLHTDGVINSWGADGGIQTNSVTRIDGNGNGFFGTVQAGAAPVAYGKSAMTVQAAGDNWEQGLEILPSKDGASNNNSGWGGIFLRSTAGSKAGSWAILRSPTAEFNIMLEGIGSRRAMQGTLNADAPFSIDLNGNTYLGGNLHAHGTVLASGAEFTNLHVAGTLKASPTEPWADYVFEPGYTPMALKEVETFAKANGHLPEVPSAAEVQKDGIDLAKMNAILLKKIEELTLHAVAQEKRMEALSAKVEALEAERK